MHLAPPADLATDAALHVAHGLPFDGAPPGDIAVEFPKIPKDTFTKWALNMVGACSRMLKVQKDRGSPHPRGHLRHMSLIRPEGSGSLIFVSWDTSDTRSIFSRSLHPTLLSLTSLPSCNTLTIEATRLWVCCSLSSLFCRASVQAAAATLCALLTIAIFSRVKACWMRRGLDEEGEGRRNIRS